MTRIFLSLLLATLLAPPALLATSPASAQTRACVQPDGTPVYTDRACASVGAVERPASSTLPGNRRVYRGGCARNLQDLMFEMSTAIDARDANRLANVYHWAGMSGRNGYSTMDRLDEVVRRPLVDIVPVLPARAESWSGVQLAHAAIPSADGRTSTAPPAIDTAAAEVATLPPDPLDYHAPPARPVALRLVQTLEDGTTPAETVFQLHEHFGCLWIRG